MMFGRLVVARTRSLELLAVPSSSVSKEVTTLRWYSSDEPSRLGHNASISSINTMQGTLLRASSKIS